ncbi:30S ribosomal protein S6e [Acidilobus sp.]|uniref:30S ribosomal protein S6e n=1 Tax=Acidilobus sp. TaxID=1872109 RepID=UPI003D091738
MPGREERPPLRIVISDPSAKGPELKVKVKGVDDESIAYTDSMKKTKELERTELPKVKMSSKLAQKLGLDEVGVVTLSFRSEGSKTNVPAKVIIDESVPENEVWAHKALVNEAAGSDEAEAYVFKAKAWQMAVPDDVAIRLAGLKIGDEFDGVLIGMPGITMRITGGTDASGFPMHPGLPGSVRRKIVLSGPPGFHPQKEGERRKKTVRGNRIPDPRAERRKTSLAQLNIIIVRRAEQKAAAQPVQQ